jgi:hypothetical protein
METKHFEAMEGMEQNLQLIFSFVGPGEWIFMAPVKRIWRTKYAEAYTSRTTHWKAVLQSETRIEMVHLAGITPRIRDFYLGRWATSCHVILKAIKLSWVWNTMDAGICSGAAQKGRLSFLRELHEDHGISLGAYIEYHAAVAPTSEVLTWLRDTNIGDWSEEGMQAILRYVAMYGRIENGIWLRQHAGLRGWPKDVIYCAAQHNQVPFIVWAKSEGCGWGEWKLEYCIELSKRGIDCKETLEWLHAFMDFPCFGFLEDVEEYQEQDTDADY